MKIVVVGAGVVGLSCAYELLRDGHEVTVLDSSAAGHGASHGNAAKIALGEAGPVPAPGMVLQGLKWMLRSDSPLYVKPSLSPPFVRFMVQLARNCTKSQFRRGLDVNLQLAESANALFDEWRGAGLKFEMHERGTVLAYEDVRQFESRLRDQETFEAYGATAEVLDERGVHEVEPVLSDRIRRGLYFPGDRQIEPDSLNRALVEQIELAGGAMLESTRVIGFDHGVRGVTAVRSVDGERHRCDGVVLASGVWTAATAAQLGAHLPIRPGKGYSVDYSPAPVSLRTALTLNEPHVAITALDGMVRVAGTMEFSGFDLSINAPRVAAIERAAAGSLRGWDPDAPHRRPWAGLRPMTPDGLPVIGALDHGRNVWVASGHGMLGLTLAPTTARLVRDLVREDRAAVPADVSPQRFGKQDRRRTSRRLTAQREHSTTHEGGSHGRLT